MKNYSRFIIDLPQESARVYIVCWTNYSHYSHTEHADIMVYHNVNGMECMTSTFSGRDTWINRPWYSYKYENAIVNALQNFRAEMRKESIAAFKREYGYKRMTKHRENEFINCRLHYASGQL